MTERRRWVDDLDVPVEVTDEGDQSEPDPSDDEEAE